MSFQNKLLYENIVRDGAEGCKRHKLVGKKYFGGLYEGSERNEDLWLEVQQYIYDNYDTEYLENVYIAGDGAPWIVAGCRDAGYWKRVSLYWTNIIWENIFTRQPHI